MSAPGMSAQGIESHAIEQRWDRVGLGVRCAYNPQRTNVLHVYIGLGRRLSRLQPHAEVRIQRRMLELLLNTARDEALPWSWRAACLEHTAWPLARLTHLLEVSTAADGSSYDERVRLVLEQLGSPAPHSAECGKP
jgi:hypothetical protein